MVSVVRLLLQGAHTHGCLLPIWQYRAGRKEALKVRYSCGLGTGIVGGAHTHPVSSTAASAGAHAHTVGIGARTRSVAIGSPGHHHR